MEKGWSEKVPLVDKSMPHAAHGEESDHVSAEERASKCVFPKFGANETEAVLNRSQATTQQTFGLSPEQRQSFQQSLKMQIPDKILMKTKQQALGLCVSGVYWLASNAALHNAFWHRIVLQITQTIYTPPYTAYVRSQEAGVMYIPRSWCHMKNM